MTCDIGIYERGDFVSIAEVRPCLRSDGSVRGAARHRSREAVLSEPLLAALAMSLGQSCFATSAWVNHYERGDFAAIHQDRPDAQLTALLALDEQAGPLVICDDLVGVSSGELFQNAMRNPFPPGEAVKVPSSRFLFIRGSETPHYRPPVEVGCRVLAVTVQL